MTSASGPDRRTDIGTGVAVAAVTALAGVPVGALWALVAPTAQVTVVERGIVIAESAGQAFVAADGWFAVLSLLAGICCGVLVHRRFADQGVAAVVGLAIGGCGAALLAWRVGALIGREPDALERAAGLPAGSMLEVGLDLRAYGVLLVWSIAAVACYFLGVLFSARADADLRPTEPDSDAGARLPEEE
jgi:hypothetical protein